MDPQEQILPREVGFCQIKDITLQWSSDEPPESTFSRYQSFGILLTGFKCPLQCGNVCFRCFLLRFDIFDPFLLFLIDARCVFVREVLTQFCRHFENICSIVRSHNMQPSVSQGKQRQQISRRPGPWILSSFVWYYILPNTRLAVFKIICLIGFCS